MNIGTHLGVQGVLHILHLHGIQVKVSGICCQGNQDHLEGLEDLKEKILEKCRKNKLQNTTCVLGLGDTYY